MIVTRTYSTQLSRFAARKLLTTNSRRPPSSLFPVSSSLSLSSSSSLLSSTSNCNYNYNYNYNEGKRTYTKTSNRRSTYEPMGDLFQLSKKQVQRSAAAAAANTNTNTHEHNIGQDFVGKTASISRVFGSSANAQALLTCGGEELAQHASFDPNYANAKDWIRSRPVGPAVLSSTLISGLVGALIEASFPQTVPVNSSISFLRPLIVGMEVAASIKVESVNETKRDGGSVNKAESGCDTGYEIRLSTQVIRVQDDVVISEGSHTVWIPGYL